MDMINSVKNLVSFFLHRIGEQNLHEDIGDKKMALRKSAIEKILKKDLNKDAYSYFGNDDLQIDLKLIEEKEGVDKIIKTIKLKIPHLFNNPGFCATIIDGEFCESLSCLPKNVKIIPFKDFGEKEFAYSLKKEKAWDNPVALINIALANSGFLLEAKKSTSQEKIIINHINSSSVSTVEHIRNIYRLGEGAKLTIVENFYNLHEPQTRVNNTVSEWILEEGAVVNLYSLDYWVCKAGSKNITNSFVHQKKNSVLSLFNCYTNVNSVKNNMHVWLEDEYANCNLYSISLLNKSSCVEDNILIEHLKKNCQSQQVYKSVISDSAKGCFDSLVLVHKDAQKTSAIQQNNNILLSENAVAQSNPQLEIFADDVVCAHGSTVGQIDSEALFYLRSRGIGQRAAYNILLKAFLHEVLDKINDPLALKITEDAINQKLKNL